MAATEEGRGVPRASSGHIWKRHGRGPTGPVSRIAALALLMVLLPSCAALESVLALSQVRFSLDGVRQVQLAGVELDRIRSYSDLSLNDALRVGSAVSQGTVPLAMTLDLSGSNPDDNPEARLVALDWVLFLRDRETISGLMEREVRFAPGAATSFPLTLSLDLLEFFQGSARDLVEVAVALASQDGSPAGVRLEVIPTVDTRLGPIRYPGPLVLER
jgi:hypothetical protein